MTSPASDSRLGALAFCDRESLTDDPKHAELMVLTACRIWRFGTEGVHSSKTDAGRWALARDPSLSAVDEALRQRTVDAAAAISPEGIAHLLALVRRGLRNDYPAVPQMERVQR